MTNRESFGTALIRTEGVTVTSKCDWREVSAACSSAPEVCRDAGVQASTTGDSPVTDDRLLDVADLRAATSAWIIAADLDRDSRLAPDGGRALQRERGDRYARPAGRFSNRYKPLRVAHVDGCPADPWPDSPPRRSRRRAPRRYRHPPDEPAKMPPVAVCAETAVAASKPSRARQARERRASGHRKINDSEAFHRKLSLSEWRSGGIMDAAI